MSTPLEKITPPPTLLVANSPSGRDGASMGPLPHPEENVVGLSCADKPELQ